MVRILSRVLSVVLLLNVMGSASAESPYVLYRSQASFGDVMQTLKMAIEEKGMYINNVMHLGEMLERTGKDLGLGESRFSKAESIEFCSSLLSSKMTEENPARILNCPYIMSVYVLKTEPDTTYIAHRRITIGDDSPVMQEVEAMLESLGAAAQEAW